MADKLKISAPVRRLVVQMAKDVTPVLHNVGSMPGSFAFHPDTKALISWEQWCRVKLERRLQRALDRRGVKL